jgi:hypothetical protein
MKALIILLTLVFVSCSGINSHTVQPTKTLSEIVPFGELTIIELDNCEYIAFQLGNHNGAVTHKGNCKYCLARNKK